MQLVTGTYTHDGEWDNAILDEYEKDIAYDYITARYVRLQKLKNPVPTENVLHIRELEVYGRPLELVNVALGKPVTTSSVYSSFSPGRATDGITLSGADYITHTYYPNANGEPWLEVDLGDDYLIGEFKIFNRLDCCKSKILGFSVIFKNSMQLITRTYTHGGEWNNAILDEYEKNIASDYVTARYVRLQKLYNPEPTENVLHIRELEVYVSPLVSWDSHNLAVGKPVESSTIHSNFVPANAVDDKPSTFFHSAYGGLNYITVDLERTTVIYGFEIYNRADCCQERILGFRVSILDEKKNEVASFDHSEWNSVIQSMYSKKLDTSILGQYLKVELNSVHVLQIGEIKVFGDIYNVVDVHKLKKGRGNLIKNSDFEFPSTISTASYENQGSLDSWGYDGAAGRILTPHVFVYSGDSDSKMVFINDGYIYQDISEYDLTGQTCNIFADVASRKEAIWREALFSFRLEDSSGSVLYQGEEILLNEFSQPGVYSGYNDQFSLGENDVGPYKLKIESSASQILVDNVKMYCKNTDHGITYSPGLKTCMSKKCDTLYNSEIGPMGWISYVVPGLVPAKFQGFVHLPSSRRTELGCTTSEGDSVIFTHVISIEACIETALARIETAINYKVSTGECALFKCDDGDTIRWVDVSDDDIYSYAKESMASQPDSDVIAASTGDLYGSMFIHQSGQHITDNTGGVGSKVLMLAKQTGYATYTVWSPTEQTVVFNILLNAKSIFVYLGDDLSSFDEEKVTYTTSSTALSLALSQGINKLWLVTKEQGAEIKNLSIIDSTAYFQSKKKDKPILAGDYVTINADFSNGESRGRMIGHVSDISQDESFLKFSRKETTPLDSTFQLTPIVNVALGKPVTTSSVYGTFSPGRATDGITLFGSAYITHTYYPNANGEPWLEIDLGADYLIDRFKIFNRLDCCKSKILGFSVIFKNSLQLVTGTYTHNEEWNNAILDEYEKDIASDYVTARYIRLQKLYNPVPTENVLHIRELEVYGRPLATDVTTCIHWYDNVLISAKSNHNINGNCGSFGCKVGIASSTMAFESIYTSPNGLQIVPPEHSTKTANDCVFAEDRFTLASGTSKMSGTTSVSFSTSDVAFYAFRQVYASRRLQWNDHIVINVGFDVGGDSRGKGTVYAITEDIDAGLGADLKTNNPPRSSFRILAPETFNGATKECVSWGDEIVLKLNNLAEEKGCDPRYGCRILYADPDGDHVTLRFGHRTSITANDGFTLEPPTNLIKHGCIHAGEQLYLVRHKASNSCGAYGCRVAVPNLDSKSFSLGHFDNADLLAFQTFT